MSSADRHIAQLDPSPVFAALGDATRLALIRRLSDGEPRSIVQLSDGLGQTRQGITKHLHVLEHVGIVVSERVGRESRFAFTPERLHDAQHYLTVVSRQWDEAAGRLTAFLRERPD